MLSMEILENDPIPEPNPTSDFGDYDSLTAWYKDQDDKVKAFLICVTLLSKRHRETIQRLISGWRFYSNIIPDVPEQKIEEITSRVKYVPSEDPRQPLGEALSLTDEDLGMLTTYVIKSLVSDRRSESIRKAFRISSKFGHLMEIKRVSDAWVNNPNESREVRLFSIIMSALFLKGLDSILSSKTNNPKKEGVSK